MKKRELNKKLQSRVLDVKECLYMKHGRVRVIRARQTQSKSGRPAWTEVDIRICAIVESNYGDWLPLTEFGARHIRKFLRRHKNNVPNTVNSWTKLWGFPSDPDITINTIELVTNPCQV